MAKHRRRTYLIKTGLQLRYMGIIISTMLMVAFGVGWIIYYTSWSRISDTPDLTIDKLGGIFDQVNTVLLKWVAVFIFVIATLSIFVSHKIAGPVYRLERMARVISSGDLTQSVRLRHGDELRELVDAFNTMTEALRKMVSKDREVISQLVSAGNKLNEAMNKKKADPTELDLIAKELYGVIDELRRVSSGFRIDKELAGGKPAAEAEEVQV